ncbi:MAG: pimeloyl-CoA dehydrogenase large subunit [Gammaproteobacteria bacterium]|nr:pimeloyl-CoA dehydrogenase large subunit [Gammaproteobacteria bacterium]
MNINFSKEDLAFKDEVKNWLDNEYPSHVKEKTDKGITISKEDLIDFHKALSKKGWMGYNWPTEYGGTGWSASKLYIFNKELGLAGCPPILPFGVGMVGPVIYTFGNDEQKDRFLPDILNFNTWWCQGYSEPGSGSDLASLKTKAVLRNDLDEDYYVVNGSKTWTTLAQNADWIFCLVRTDNSGIKQEGISFLLIDMKSPGIEVKPIITIDGDHEVNSVFFTDVKVPAKNLIGEEGKGWTYAKFLLAHERFGIAGVGASMRSLNRLKDIISQLDNDDLQRKVNQLEIDLSAIEITELRLLSALENGGHPGAESSILKIKGTEMQQALSELFVEASGEYALMYPGPHGYENNYKPAGPDYAAEGLSAFLNMRKTSIYGGSNEIQKNILSKFVLGV